jgi:hypothetical protein
MKGHTGLALRSDAPVVGSRRAQPSRPVLTRVRTEEPIFFGVRGDVTTSRKREARSPPRSRSTTAGCHPVTDTVVAEAGLGSVRFRLVRVATRDGESGPGVLG